MSQNDNRLNVVKNTLLACRTNDPDEAAAYIELIDKVSELMNYQGEVKRVDQWVDEIKDYEMQAEGQDRHAERFNESHNDFVERVFAKIQEL